MSLKMRISSIGTAAAMTMAILVAGAHPGHAATAACGSGCTSPVSLSAGTGEALTVSLSGTGCSTTVTAANLEKAVAGTSSCTVNVGLAAASATNAGQDWLGMQEGGGGAVQTFINNGAMPARLAIQYGGDLVVEFEAVPDGVPTALCLADNYDPDGGYSNGKLELTSCGTTYNASYSNPQGSSAPSQGMSESTTSIASPTAWIIDANNTSNGYTDLINGDDDQFSLPTVLAVSGSSLTEAQLSEMNGVVSSTQMWSFSYGGTSAAAVKAGLKHT